VLETAPASLAKKLEAHGMTKTPRISTAGRLARIVDDLAKDPAVDGDVLLTELIAAGSTGVALALGSPAHAKDLLHGHTSKHELDLSQLDLAALPDTIGLAPPDVTRLSLSHNRIREISPALAKLGKLRQLFLDYNGMRAIPKAVFELSSLESLALNDNELASVPDAIGDLSNLRELWLSDNPLEELPRGLLRLTKLRFLHLGDLPWKEPAPFIADMTSLEELWLASHSLEHLPAEICKLPKLRRLHLWYSNLSSVPEELFACTKLEELRITNNPLPDETMARLRKALSKTTIY
jgi:internalin A